MQGGKAMSRFLDYDQMNDEETEQFLRIVRMMKDTPDVGFHMYGSSLTYNEYSEAGKCYVYSVGIFTDNEFCILSLDDIELRVATKANAKYYAERIENARQAI
jgi:hypothetical protein